MPLPKRTKIICNIWIGVIWWLCGTANAHDKNAEHAHPTPIAATELYQPAALPDRIVLTWTGDPATTQAVTWRTSGAAEQGWAEIAIAEAGPGFGAQAIRVAAASERLATAHNEAFFHTVEFENLLPATKYAYRVGDGVNWSEWFHFSTASPNPEPFSFIYFGDAQNDIKSLWSRVVREAYGDQPEASFLLHAGDLVDSADSDSQWGEWCAAGGWLNAMLPSIAVPGNHEWVTEPNGSKRLSKLWRPQFAFPKNAPPGLEETCYTLVYQGVRLVCLNSNTQHQEQAVWLEGVLADNTCRWIICTFHHPIFSTGRGRDNREQRALWKPILDKYHVDLVLQGHDHTYGRTGLETPTVKPEEANLATGTNTVDNETGTVYVVSVSGPKMYVLKPQPFMVRMAEDTQLYQIIQVDGNQLRYEARTAIGEVYDAFTLIKHAGSVNELIDQIPETPERRMNSQRREGLLDRLYAGMDHDKDGKLTRDEVSGRLKENFAVIDANQDGAVSQAELKAALESMGVIK